VSAAATALLSAVVAGFTAFTTSMIRDSVEARRRRAERRQDKLDDIVARYRDPLAFAAFELQGRMYNIVRLGFLEKHLGDERLDDYAVDSTLWLVAQYFGWSELIRQEIELLDLGDLEQNRTLRRLLGEVTDAFSLDTAGPMRILRAEQRGIGELMILTPSDVARPRPLGYASFRRNVLRDADVSWLARLAEDIRAWHKDPDNRFRAVLLQRALLDVVDYLDRNRSRFREADRTKLDMPG